MSDGFFCIYSGKECPESKRSDEHIVPYAIGGSNDFTTRDVSIAANSTVGAEVDSAMVNDFRIMLHRIRLNLAGQSGIVPSVPLQGSIMMDGREHRVAFTIHQGTAPTLKLMPEVQHDGHSINIQCDPADVPNIIRNLNRKYRKQGKRLDLSTTRFVTTVTKDPKVSTQAKMKAHAFHRAVIKMAIGTAHFALGYDWSRTSYADDLRRCLSEPDRSKWPSIRRSIPIAGAPRDVRDVWSIGDDKHVLTLFNYSPHMPLMFQCLLFGGVVYGAVRLADAPWIGSALGDAHGVVFVVDCRSRSLSKFTVAEFLRLRVDGAFES